ncbi:hypothetical protein K2X30_06865 [bacterium]|jgi:hypothetical protein|nr:hypothetical protein [bacterium]
MKPARRNFLKQVLGALAAISGAQVLFQACGTSSSSDGSGSAVNGGNCLANGTSTIVSEGHTPNHTLTVPLADVTAGTQQTYTLTANGSGHTHTVTVTAAHFTSLQANQGVSIASTTSGIHSHTVTINCV